MAVEIVNSSSVTDDIPIYGFGNCLGAIIKNLVEVFCNLN